MVLVNAVGGYKCALSGMQARSVVHQEVRLFSQLVQVRILNADNDFTEFSRFACPFMFIHRDRSSQILRHK